MERFLADPRVRPLAPLGPCQVAACSRRSESEHGYCPTHYVRWRATVTAAPGTDQRHWQLTCPAVSEAGQVSLRGLAPLVVLQVLTGIQHRVQVHGAKITDVNLRAVCDSLRRQQATSAETADIGQVPGKPARSLLRAFARHARPPSWPGAVEQIHDTWDLAVFGHPGGLSFTAISQAWLGRPPNGGRPRNYPATAAAAPVTSARRSTRWRGCHRACAAVRTGEKYRWRWGELTSRPSLTGSATWSRPGRSAATTATASAAAPASSSPGSAPWA